MTRTAHPAEDPALGAALAAVRAGVPETALATPLDDVLHRGNRLRRRRTRIRGGLVTGAVVGALAVTVGASTGGFGAQSWFGGHGRTLAAGGRTVNVDLSGWSVHTNADATVTVTVHGDDLVDPDRLRRVLAQAGVPARIQVVPVVRVATTPPTTVLGCSGPGQDGMPEIVDVLGVPSVRPRGTSWELTIRPGAMPAGSVLSFVFFTDPGADPHTHWLRTPPLMSLHPGTPPPCVVPTTLPPGTGHPGAAASPSGR